MSYVGRCSGYQLGFDGKRRVSVAEVTLLCELKPDLERRTDRDRQTDRRRETKTKTAVDRRMMRALGDVKIN